MNEHQRDQDQKERQAKKDNIIVGIYDSIEDGEPDISTERLLQQTADSAHCEVDRVIYALHRQNRTSIEQKPTPNYELLARRAYPNLEPSHICSRHNSGQHFECQTCYPNWIELIDGHQKVSDKLYGQLLELSGLSDPPNGRIGTNAIVAELKKKLLE